MQRLFYFSAFFLFFQFSIQAQTKSRMLKKGLVLQMALTSDDDAPGTRGASVVWHPVQKKYYAAMAGNVSYPLCVFNAAGKRLSPDSHVTEADVRGLWYHSGKKAIQGNTFGAAGWFQYKLGTGGLVEAVEEVLEGQNQPTEQCVGALYPAKKQVLFLKGSQVLFYDEETGELTDSIAIHWGRKTKDGPAEEEDINVTPGDYNKTTLVFTGIKGAEIGFLNTVENNIELYHIKTGYLTQLLELPKDAVTESSFNFAFTNGTYWLFNMETRQWTGYK